MVDSKQAEDSSGSEQSQSSQQENRRAAKGVAASRKRKSEEREENVPLKKLAKADKAAAGEKKKKESKKKKKVNPVQQKLQQKPVHQTEEERATTDDNNDDCRSDVSNISVVKKKKPTTTPQFNKLQELEDKSSLCVVGETEANIFPRKLNFMNHKIDVMYDSRVHPWFKADDLAKALGYKNYRSAIERYVNPSFVRTFPEVLDMSRSRYGDAYHLYSVNSKVLFINEAGMLQLLLRSMISNDTAAKEETSAQNVEEAATPENRGTKHHPKPKLSADWIMYQILPSLIAYSEAARNGITAQEERCLQTLNRSIM